MATCYRHPSRETGVSCSSCGRPICPDCMTTTPVGMRCPECAKQRTRVVRMRTMVTQPRITYALIAVNVLVFLAEGRFSAAGGGGGGSIYEHGALLGSTGLRGLENEGVAHGQWWRILTGGFLHANLLHIFFNMYVLYLLGQLLEPAVGHVRFALVYLVALIAGSLGALLLTPHTFTVGASGAVFGLMGAAAVEMRARRIPVMQSGIGVLIVINLLFSITVSGISIGGHLGGLIGGALAAGALQLGERYRSQALALAGCAVIAIACFAGSVATANSSSTQSTAPGQIELAPPE
jgi:membrane associated rhomboid family serine protease